MTHTGVFAVPSSVSRTRVSRRSVEATYSIDVARYVWLKPEQIRDGHRWKWRDRLCRRRRRRRVGGDHVGVGPGNRDLSHWAGRVCDVEVAEAGLIADEEEQGSVGRPAGASRALPRRDAVPCLFAGRGVDEHDCRRNGAGRD